MALLPAPMGKGRSTGWAGGVDWPPLGWWLQSLCWGSALPMGHQPRCCTVQAALASFMGKP